MLLLRSLRKVSMKHKEKKIRTKKAFPWRVLGCVILGLCIAANMVMIFGFSTEDREASGDRSHGVTETIVEIVVKDYETMTPTEQEAVIETYHPPIRKLAHFCEFGLLGVLTAAFMNTLGKGKKWLWWVIPAGFCLLYAISDEVHQIFTARGPAVTDVLIDFSGSVTGIVGINLIILLAVCLHHKRKEKRHARDKV